jgi:zinc D-Ala-D-Ala carboxypeptidase
MRLRPRRPPRPQVARLVLAGALLVTPIVAPSSAAGVGPLPECRLDDILTEPRGYDDWRITLVDWILKVGKDYVPPDLVSVREGGVAGGGYVREVVIEDLRAMAKAAEANGTPLVAWSPYRGYQQQKKLFKGYARGDGFEDAITYSARPGHSEHQLGSTIDFVAVGDSGLTSNWEVTPTGGWMSKNAWKYGWLMSYPKGKRRLTCYGYEPWHYRYVGRELAREIHGSGLTIREYLWANYTQIDPSTGEPLPSAGPSDSPSTSPAPPASAGPIPTVAATQPPAVAPTPTPSNSGGVGFWTELPALGGLLVALAAVALIAIGLWRRPRRR